MTKLETCIDMKNTEIHQELYTDEVYNILRQMHSELKDILYMDNSKKWSDKQLNVLEALNQVLYVTEGFFTQF